MSSEEAANRQGFQRTSKGRGRGALNPLDLSRCLCSACHFATAMRWPPPPSFTTTSTDAQSSADRAAKSSRVWPAGGTKEWAVHIPIRKGCSVSSVPPDGLQDEAWHCSPGVQAVLPTYAHQGNSSRQLLLKSLQLMSLYAANDQHTDGALVGGRSASSSSPIGGGSSQLRHSEGDFVCFNLNRIWLPG